MLHPQPRLFDSRHALFEIDNLDERRHDREIVSLQDRRDRRHRASSPSSESRSSLAVDETTRRGPRAAEPRVSGAGGALPEPGLLAVWSAATGTKDRRNRRHRASSPSSESRSSLAVDEIP